MEFLCIWSHVKIQISAKNFVSSFSRKDHLDAQALDFPGHQIHRCRSADAGYIISFDMIYNIAQSVDAFLNGKFQFVVYTANILRNLASKFNVGRPLQSDRKGM